MDKKYITLFVLLFTIYNSIYSNSINYELNNMVTQFVDVEEYDPSKSYTGGSQVHYNCIVWENNWYANPGDIPGENNVWRYVSDYNGVECTNVITSYCGFQIYNENLAYSINGTKVYYDCIIWESNNYVNPGNIPGESSVWSFFSECSEDPNCNEPISYCGFQIYNENLAYPINGTKVYFDCTIWENLYYMNPNEAPGTNEGWVWVSNCTEEVGCDNLYCGFPLYKPSIPYAGGSQVYYNSKIWEASYYASPGSYPGTAEMWIDTGDVCPDPTSPTLSIEDELLKQNILIYYSNNNIYYDFSKLDSKSQIICYDAKGSIVFSKEVLNSKDIINLPPVHQGLYFLQILNNNARTFKKIIVLE